MRLPDHVYLPAACMPIRIILFGLVHVHVAVKFVPLFLLACSKEAFDEIDRI
jgi:hypothetical protein